MPSVLNYLMNMWNSMYASWLLFIIFVVGLRTFQHPSHFSSQNVTHIHIKELLGTDIFRTESDNAELIIKIKLCFFLPHCRI